DPVQAVADRTGAGARLVRGDLAERAAERRDIVAQRRQLVLNRFDAAACGPSSPLCHDPLLQENSLRRMQYGVAAMVPHGRPITAARPSGRAWLDGLRREREVRASVRIDGSPIPRPSAKGATK